VHIGAYAPGGLADTAQLVITIHAVDDAAVANNHTGSATEAGGTLNLTLGSNATGNVPCCLRRGL
jgi:hypothetical protein